MAGLLRPGQDRSCNQIAGLRLSLSSPGMCPVLGMAWVDRREETRMASMKRTRGFWKTCPGTSLFLLLLVGGASRVVADCSDPPTVSMQDAAIVEEGNVGTKQVVAAIRIFGCGRRASAPGHAAGDRGDHLALVRDVILSLVVGRW